MAILPEPYEYLDLAPGASIMIRVDAYEDGSAVIHPRNPSPRHVRQHMAQNNLEVAPPAGTPISVETPVLRLFGERLDDIHHSRYYDISSKTLRADLLARLTGGMQLPATITLTAHGAAPQKRYSVAVI